MRPSTSSSSARNRPPVHFSPADPWRAYRLALQRTLPLAPEKIPENPAAAFALPASPSSAGPWPYAPAAFGQPAHGPRAAAACAERVTSLHRVLSPLPAASAAGAPPDHADAFMSSLPKRSASQAARGSHSFKDLPVVLTALQQNPRIARPASGSTSRFRGVIWDVASLAWRAKVKVKGRTWYLGIYHNDTEAAAAYDAATWFLLGRKAVVNFPSVDYDLVDPPRAPPDWIVQHIVNQMEMTRELPSGSFRRWIAKNPMDVLQKR